MGDATALDEERPDPDEALRAILDLERSTGEVGFAGHAVEPLRQPPRCDDPHAAGRVELVAEVVAERHEVDEVVRVEVADDHRSQVFRLETTREAGKGALADVQADRLSTVGHDIARRGRAGSTRVRRT